MKLTITISLMLMAIVGCKDNRENENTGKEVVYYVANKLREVLPAAIENGKLKYKVATAIYANKIGVPLNFNEIDRLYDSINAKK